MKEKSGGEYVTIDEQIKKIDVLKQIIITASGICIPVCEVIDMQSDIFKVLDY